ncbi:MAG: hypothetical protein MK110_01065 [Fuerstiella sp.]|nr:hypothetical protein [Fuerstiella sp.]
MRDPLTTLQQSSANRPPQQQVIVHAAYPLWRKHLLLTVARAKQLQDDGDNVVVTYCNSRSGTCAVNYAGSPLACLVCKTRARKTAEAAGLQTVPLDTPVTREDAKHPLTLQDRRELAEGVQSGVTTTFRTMNGEVSRRSLIGSIRRRYYKTAQGLLRSMDALVRDVTPDRIEVFNGRHACSRFCLIAARRFGIAFNTLEVTTAQKPIIFQGHTAHDRKAIQQRVRRQPADYRVAEKFYGGRRRPQINKYARKHAVEFRPPDAADFQKKIGIFLSSQDEFESLGKEWVSPFLDYAPIVERACRENPDYLFCIRFHPNQADIAADVVEPFRNVAELPNVRIYEPTDTANTYTLMQWSDQVVTFGSSVTIEACWMNKPAIMLGPSLYDDLEISHNPASVDEFLELLRKDLPVGSRENAARFAYFEQYDQDELRYIRYTGKTMVAQGIKIRYPLLSQIMRTSDDVLCRAVKLWTRVLLRLGHSAAEGKTQGVNCDAA